MTHSTYSHQHHGKAIPGSSVLGCSDRVGLKDGGLLGTGVLKILFCILTPDSEHAQRPPGVATRHTQGSSNSQSPAHGVV